MMIGDPSVKKSLPFLVRYRLGRDRFHGECLLENLDRQFLGLFASQNSLLEQPGFDLRR